ncbi:MULTISPECIES: hypothetical protein [unclassified Bartonella]|uniref:hypothetical protein n=1 Tax=unclassified Bartonella TaxID=2645622 RepID=UPI00235E826C|nr:MULTISPECIES: hypothetical protein [unclassified Bartonella]
MPFFVEEIGCFVFSAVRMPRNVAYETDVFDKSEEQIRQKAHHFPNCKDKQQE